VLVRHRESAGNVARDRAEASGELLIDLATRDMDVRLSDLLRLQAGAVGEWIRSRRRGRPSIVLCSPDERAHQTATVAVAASGLEVPIVLDERLREREVPSRTAVWGSSGAPTTRTSPHRESRARRSGSSTGCPTLASPLASPEQGEARARVGTFYRRPPGGESWCDVALRVRSVVDTVSREHAGEHVYGHHDATRVTSMRDATSCARPPSLAPTPVSRIDASASSA
jgi:broad specificity phosphatase PhoE